MTDITKKSIAIIGAGPAGLFAAELLAERGARVTIYDRMPNVARKFLLAGRGGLNVSNAEPLEKFLEAYGHAREFLAPIIARFTPDELRAWSHALGEETFVGSSGRVFPKSFKASPLLRAWLRRLSSLNVAFELRHHWVGFGETNALRFSTPDGETTVKADAVLLALGGASWPRLGADGGWTTILQERGIRIAPLRASNVGVNVPWSTVLIDRFAGTPLKRLTITCGDHVVNGEAMITQHGLEGGAIYALSPEIRKALDETGSAHITLDLRRDLSSDIVLQKLQRPRGKDSVSNYLRKTLALDPAAIALLRERDATGVDVLPQDPALLAAFIKALPLRITGQQGLDRAISTAGGIALSEVDDALMLKRLSGIFVAGEMLDWDAPTGGYLLQACFATAKAAADGIIRSFEA